MVIFENPVEGKFIRREKRFFAYIEINGKEEKCYCPNTGKMTGLLVPGALCLVSQKPTGMRYQWEAVNLDGVWIGVNTANPNKLAPEAIKKLVENGSLEPDQLKPEVKFGQFRVDYKLGNQLIEIKNVHWVKEGCAYFPDCVTSRGARQLNDMINLQNEGFRCYNIYILQRNDCEKLSVSPIDPLYYKNSIEAKTHGINSFSFNCTINKTSIEINKQIEFFL